jgi:replicative DNA helicase
MILLRLFSIELKLTTMILPKNKVSDEFQYHIARLNCCVSLLVCQLRQNGTELVNLLELAKYRGFNFSQHFRLENDSYSSIQSLLIKAIDKIEILEEMDGNITGAKTWFTDLDEMISGLQPSDLIFIAGFPLVGKTIFAINIAVNLALKSGMPVLIFSMGTPAVILSMMMLSMVGGIDQQKVRKGKLDNHDWQLINSTVDLLAETKLFIDDTHGLTSHKVQSIARRLFREQGQLGLIVIDDIHLMQSPLSGYSPDQQLSGISKNLKLLAKELHVPVIVLSQLKNNVEQRVNKKPTIIDLRESGVDDQYADLIMYVYRDEIYNEGSQDKGVTEIIVGKQCNGPLGTVRLNFFGQYYRFENINNFSQRSI